MQFNQNYYVQAINLINPTARKLKWVTILPHQYETRFHTHQPTNQPVQLIMQRNETHRKRRNTVIRHGICDRAFAQLQIICCQ